MEVDQAKVEGFADEITRNGFPRSHMEIDDRWSIAYGDFEFDSFKFPDAAGMIRRLHQQGFSVTVWIIPFAEPSSRAFAEGAAAGHWLRGSDGRPQEVTWWQGRGVLLNVSDSRALDWFEARLRRLMADTGVDGFKFDAGEGDFVPSSDKSMGHDPPGRNSYARLWAQFASRFGGAGEVRAAHASQDVSIWVREFDKESVWGEANGLMSLVTTALQLGVIGYPWVLPDMVGGNAYNAAITQPAVDSDNSVHAGVGEHAGEANGPSGKSPGATDDVTDVTSETEEAPDTFWFGSLPEEELYTRWCFANALLPAVQFSIAPWQYGASTTAACRQALDLRKLHLPLLEELSMSAVRTGAPIVRPLWWLDPLDPNCQAIGDEFLLGNSTLVAPVLRKSAVKRDIYLPRGKWATKGRIYEGPTWLYAYAVPQDDLAIFVLQ